MQGFLLSIRFNTETMTRSVAQALWDANESVAIACLNNAFVKGIADGTLSKERFAYYVGQDAFFLEAFARAYSIAAAKAPDRDGFTTFHRLADGVLEELTLHQHYAAQWGVDLQSVNPGAATRRYTDFLLATAWSQGVGVTTAAMLPCMKLYAFLGEQIAASGLPSHGYSDWIQTYASSEFHELAKLLGELGDRYSQLDALTQTTYRYAMECELDFFQAAWDEIPGSV